MQLRIKTSTLSGETIVPPSKSHTLRAILLASLANGESIIRHPLHSPDADAMIRACEFLGAKMKFQKNQWIIAGVAGKPHSPPDIIDAGNSGIVLRFIAAVAALTSGDVVITGDHSIRTNRPIKPLLEGLTQLHVSAISIKGNDHAPIMIKGPLQAGEAHLNGEDSQPVSALLIAAAFVSGITTLHVSNPGEKPWIDLTLDWFDRLGIKYQRNGYTEYRIAGSSCYGGFEYEVPGDFSSAAFLLVAALITHSELTLHHLDLKDSQGDKAILSILEKMGARLVIHPEKKMICVKKSGPLKGITIDINHCIDALPILSVLACFAQGETRLMGAAIARAKESDRLSAMRQELQKMGACISETNDGLIIQGSPLHQATVESHHDHRVALSLAVAALATPGETIIRNTNCISKSYPDFASNFQKLGASIF
jgi:3-phosphoshikimate 1-carboxyvinyltransferase